MNLTPCDRLQAVWDIIHGDAGIQKGFDNVIVEPNDQISAQIRYKLLQTTSTSRFVMCPKDSGHGTPVLQYRGQLLKIPVITLYVS